MPDLCTPAKRSYEMIDIGDDKPTRVLVVTHNGFDGFVARWTSSCSGCSPSVEETGYEDGGIGCFECGYTGKRRREEWCPLPRELKRYMKYDKEHPDA